MAISHFTTCLYVHAYMFAYLYYLYVYMLILMPPKWLSIVSYPYTTVILMYSIYYSLLYTYT